MDLLTSFGESILQRRTMFLLPLFLVSLVIAPTGCGDESAGGQNNQTNLDGTVGQDATAQDGGVSYTPRQWSRQLVQENSDRPDIAISGDGTVDIVYLGSVNNEFGIVWQEWGSTPELIEVLSLGASRPRVGRDANGTVHVVWGGAAVPYEVRYAVRLGTNSWSVSTIEQDRYGPDLVIASDGTPHVAFVDKETGNAMAYHAVPDTIGWQISPVNGTDWFGNTEVAIALTDDDLPIVSAPNSDGMGVWVAESDSNGNWTITDLAIDRMVEETIDVAANSLGVAVAFRGNTYNLVAWRAAGSAEWLVEQVTSYDPSRASGLPIAVAVGEGGPMVVTVVHDEDEHPDGLTFLERPGSDWFAQLLGPNACTAAAVALDAQSQPAIAIECGDDIYYMTVIGDYPQDWLEQCEAANTAMCQAACTCGVGGEECCWGVPGSLRCNDNYNCLRNDALCADPTITPTELQLCRDELPSLSCGAGLDLSGACARLFDPFNSQ